MHLIKHFSCFRCSCLETTPLFFSLLLRHGLLFVRSRLPSRSLKLWHFACQGDENQLLQAKPVFNSSCSLYNITDVQRILLMQLSLYNVGSNKHGTFFFYAMDEGCQAVKVSCASDMRILRMLVVQKICVCTVSRRWASALINKSVHWNVTIMYLLSRDSSLLGSFLS